jgi:serine/threonine protein kinase
VFAGYTVIRQLGSGGMGAVYLVRHPRLPRYDALKLLRSELSADPEFARRFLREADVVAGLTHRNIVSVLDRGEHDGQLWLTMQYVDGIDAEQALADSGGLLPAERVAHIATEVAAALDAAHRAHLIHRDVKPANILLAAPADEDDPEQVFLTDFGIAKSLESGNTRLTRTGAVVATFDYASPEQIESRSPDARSDVYSLGCVLFKLLTGRVPFPGPGVAAAIHGHLQLPPPRPTSLVPWLAPGIDAVVARAMAKDPADRYPSCRALASAAARALADFPEPPAPPYTVMLAHGGSGSVVGPMITDSLSQQATERLVDLVRRTRFFDLPENIHQVAGRTTTGHRPRGGRPVTIEIRSGQRVGRVTADLDEARRPATLDALVDVIEHLPPAPDHPPAPATVLHDLRAAQQVIAAAQAPPGPTGGGTSLRPVVREAPSPARSTAPPPVRQSPRPLPAYLSPHGAGVATGYAEPGRPLGPGGPGGPGVPQAYPGGPAPPRRRGPILLVALAVLALAVAGGGVWWLSRDGTPGSSGSSSASETPSASTPPGVPGLPAGDPLPDTTLVAPRTQGDNTDLYLLDTTTGGTTLRLTSAPEADTAPLLSPDRRTIAYVQQSADGNGVSSPPTALGTGRCSRPRRRAAARCCGRPGTPSTGGSSRWCAPTAACTRCTSSTSTAPSSAISTSASPSSTTSPTPTTAARSSSGRGTAPRPRRCTRCRPTAAAPRSSSPRAVTPRTRTRCGPPTASRSRSAGPRSRSPARPTSSS